MLGFDIFVPLNQQNYNPFVRPTGSYKVVREGAVGDPFLRERIVVKSSERARRCRMRKPTFVPTVNRYVTRLRCTREVKTYL